MTRALVRALRGAVLAKGEGRNGRKMLQTVVVGVLVLGAAVLLVRAVIVALRRGAEGCVCETCPHADDCDQP